MELTPKTLRLPARHAARIVARTRLRALLERAERLKTVGNDAPEENDDEAVHDFRVALRRLRSWLRACAPALDDTVRGKTLERLRELSRLAGAARDLEVQRKWLLEVAGDEEAGEARKAARRMAHRLAGDYAEAIGRLAKSLRRKLPKTAGRLADQLGHYVTAIDLDAPSDEPTMAALMARLLRDHASDLREALALVRRPAHVAEAHHARIEAKRLRYLLEALGDRRETARRAAMGLARLQDALGALHDRHMLQELLRKEKRNGRKRGHEHSRVEAASLAALRSLLRRETSAAFGLLPMA